MEKIKATEAVNVIRRMVREYETFKEAEQIAALLADHEMELAILKTDIKEAEAVEKAMSDKLDDLDKRLDEAVTKVEEAKAIYDSVVKKAALERDEILARARKDVAEMFAQAEAKKLNIKTEIEGLEVQRVQAEQDTRAAVIKLDDISRMLEVKKQEIARLLG